MNFERIIIATRSSETFTIPNDSPLMTATNEVVAMLAASAQHTVFRNTVEDVDGLVMIAETSELNSLGIIKANKTAITNQFSGIEKMIRLTRRNVESK